MFKKSADLIHLRGRAGTHATKPSATGRVDLRRLDETDYNRDLERSKIKAERKILAKKIRLARRNANRLLVLMEKASSAGDFARAEGFISAIERLWDNIDHAERSVGGLTRDWWKA